MILRDLELPTAAWLVSAYSKGFSESRAEGTGEACVYPSGMIRETETKSRGKLLAAGPKASRRALPRKGLALAGDYADVLNACLPHLIDYGGDIAILGSSVGVDEDRRTGVFF